MNTSPHFNRRLGLAWASCGLIKRLSPSGKGLSPWCNRKSAICLLVPILSYGADLFIPNAATLRKLDAFWHQVLRWITNCFRTTPSSILYCEASVPPMSIMLAHKRRLASLRLLCSPPTIDPTTACLPTSSPTWSPSRAPSHRHLLTGLQGSKSPAKWSSPTSGCRRHLPLDSTAHSVLDIIPDRLPLVQPHLICPTPYDPVGLTPYRLLKDKAFTVTMSSWSSSAPTPKYYFFARSLVPHPFMGLPRFSAGRIHQMRSQNSYLASHSSWSSRDLSPLCPACEEDDETFEHAVLHCRAKSSERTSHLQGISDIGPDTHVWSSTTLLLDLTRFISATATGFPPHVPPTYIEDPSSSSGAGSTSSSSS